MLRRVPPWSPSLLTGAEASSRVRFHPEDDPEAYPPIYKKPLGLVAALSESLPLNDSGEGGERYSVYDRVFKGYSEWAVPVDEEAEANPMVYMMRRMQTQFFYSGFGSTNKEQPYGGYPEKQMQRLFSAPCVRELASWSDSSACEGLVDKIFVLKVYLHPLHTCPDESKSFNKKLDDPNVVCWRLLTVFGGTTLATMHDRILAPAMGWVRHYHSYKFIDPATGACFGPLESHAIDAMHTVTSFVLDDESHRLCHVLRRVGDRAGYVYDMGDKWHHVIELVHIGNRGDALSAATIQAFLPTNDGVLASENVLSGVQLIAGAVNAAPEDSVGCKGMGNYGNILRRGASHRSTEAAGALNWKANGIRCAFSFDLAAHQERLAEALADKSSERGGQKSFNFSLSGGHNAAGPVLTETVSKNPKDPRAAAMCAQCGLQPRDKRLMVCGGCKVTWYCAEACQKQHWKTHKQQCRALKEARAESK